MLTPPRFAAVPDTGADILLDDDGAGVARTASGTFLRLQSPPPDLIEILTGTAAGTTDSRTFAADLRDELGARRVREAEARWPAERRRAVVIGTPGIADDLAAALEDWQVEVTRYPHANALDPAAGTDARLVIAIAQTPSQRAGWAELDALPRAGTAWLRAYREGEVCYVDPLGLDADDPTSEQVRRRRLAASPVPAELTAWQDGAPPPAADLDTGTRALLVARILRLALAWAQDAPGLTDLRRTLWRLNAATGTSSEHIVQPYPAPPVPRHAAGAARPGAGPR